MVTEEIAKQVKSAEIYTAQNFSDHAPVILEYAIKDAQNHEPSLIVHLDGVEG